MNTITIEVDGKQQTNMLVEWLKSIEFVKHVKVTTKQKSNVEEIADVLNRIDEQGILLNITNPVQYQKDIRNEW